MEKWHIFLGCGLIVGIVTLILDNVVDSVPDYVILFCCIVGIVLIFTGMTLRRKTLGRNDNAV